MDVVSPQKRSQIMSSVRGYGNVSTEISLARIFMDLGLSGWRRRLPIQGKPDFVFKKKRVAVFADGCFWHGHKCRNTVPKTNSMFWRKKIATNKARDLKVNRLLRAEGWHVFRIWECAISKKRLPRALVKLLKD